MKKRLNVFIPLLLVFFALYYADAASHRAPAEVVQAPTQAAAQPKVAPLSWEVGHPERKPWSDYLKGQIDNQYAVFMKASDIKVIIPKLDNYTREQRVALLSEFFVGIALYESAYDPAAVSEDVNGSSKPEDMATGFFQLNASMDQKVYHTGTNFTYQQLKDPFNNIKAGVGIVVYLIQQRGKILIPKGEGGNPSVFFATIHPGGMYDESAAILKMVASLF